MEHAEPRSTVLDTGVGQGLVFLHLVESAGGASWDPTQCGPSQAVIKLSSMGKRESGEVGH